MKIMTLNAWGFFEWDKRKELLIKFLKEKSPDIVFIQEAASDERLKWENQVEEINEKLNYESKSYTAIMEMKKWHQKPIDWKMDYGLGILSKFPIIHKELVVLPGVKKDKKSGFLHVILETPQGKIDLINVHFENTDEGAREHLKSTLQWCKEREVQPIIAGDFNMVETEFLITTAESYMVSYDIEEYYSFMPTEFSHHKEPITLDYIMVHKKKFRMDNVECVQNDVSDHNPVLADVEPNPNL